MLNKKNIILLLLGFSLFFFTVKTINLYPFLFQLLFSKKIELKQVDQSINILLLGISGGTHEGPDLTDTIIFLNINPQKNKVNLVSLPRDLWVPDLNGKINTAYSYGESKRKGGGLILAKATVSSIMNQPIDYAVRIDFAGFVKAVDLIGGLDINVDKGFQDPQYPIEGKETDPCGKSQEEIEKSATFSSQLEAFPCRYKLASFNLGEQHMDGKTALEFVRSRHAEGDEGTDFARSKRQEKVISTFKNQVLSAQTYLNPTRIINLYSIFEKSLDTDIKKDEYDDFIRLGQKIKAAKIKSFVLDYGDEDKPGLLINPPISKEYQNLWVLIPRTGNGNFSEIQNYITCIENSENCEINKEP